MAILSTTLPTNQSVNLVDTPGFTIASLIMCDLGSGNTTSTDGGTSFAQTLYDSSTTLTFDSGVAGVPAVLTEQTKNYGTGSGRGSCRDVIYASIVLNSDLIINMNGSDNSSSLLFRSATNTFYCTGHTVTVNGATAGTTALFDQSESGGTWAINAKIAVSGIYFDHHWQADEVIANPGGTLQCFGPLIIGLNTLMVNNGTVNFGGNTVYGQAMGALSGTSSSWGGVVPMLLEGGIIASAGTPNYSGALDSSWTQLDGGTQIFSGTTTNTSGPTVVNGGLLILDKTSGYAISGSGVTYAGYATQGPMLHINGGAVQFQAANQVDPAVPITIDGGSLLLGGNSQTSSQPLTLVSNPNNSGLVNVIDFGTTTPSATNTVLTFADSHSVNWTGSNVVRNWIGTPNAGGGQDQFFVGTSADLTQLSVLKFVNADGTIGTTVGATQLATGEIVASALPSMWAASAGGSWNTSTDWTSGSAPNGVHTIANFVGSPYPVGITGAAVVTLDGSKIVGQLNFNSTESVTINAGSGGTLTINDNADPNGVTPTIYAQLGSHTINVPLAYNAGLTVSLSHSATLSLGSTLTGTGNLAVTGAGTLQLASSTVLPNTNVSISNGATLALASAVGSQTIAGLTMDSLSTLNMGKQMMTVPDTGAAGSTYASLLALIKSGYVHSGAGITSSNASGSSGIGILDSGTQTKFGYTLLGDATMDGSVGFADLVKLAQNYATSGTNWGSGDFNYDGSTGFADLVKLAQNYTLQVSDAQASELDTISPSFSADWAAAQAQVAAVPEPTTLGLLAVGAVGLLARRRRHA